MRNLSKMVAAAILLAPPVMAYAQTPTPAAPTSFKISIDLTNDLYKYLATRPYAEAAPLIQRLQAEYAAATAPAKAPDVPKALAVPEKPADVPNGSH